MGRPDRQSVVHRRPAEHTVRCALGIPEVSNVGRELDRKLGADIQSLEIDYQRHSCNEQIQKTESLDAK